MIDWGIRCSEIGCAIPTILYNFWEIVALIVIVSIFIILKNKKKETAQ